MSERERLLLGEIESRLNGDDPELVHRLEAVSRERPTPPGALAGTGEPVVSWRPPRVATAVLAAVVAGAILMFTLITMAMQADREARTPGPSARVEAPGQGGPSARVETP